MENLLFYNFTSLYTDHCTKYQDIIGKERGEIKFLFS